MSKKVIEENKYEEYRDLVLGEYKDNNIVIMTIEGPHRANLTELIDQPADGILYDLNRSEEVVLTFIEDQKWVNDYAVCKVIRELKRINELYMCALSQIANDKEVHNKENKQRLCCKFQDIAENALNYSRELTKSDKRS